MNKKLKTIFCVTIVLFCTVLCLQAQEKYLTQSDIDAFIANLEAIANDEMMKEGDIVDFSGLAPLPTTAEFVDALGDFKEPLSKVLQKHGLNKKHPAESFYTIILGYVLVQVEYIFAEMLEEERQMLEETEDFAIITTLKESIHPDDLSLLKENSEELDKILSDNGLAF